MQGHLSMGSKFYVIYNINMIHICIRGVRVDRTWVGGYLGVDREVWGGGVGNIPKLSSKTKNRHFGFKAYPYTLVLLYRLMSYLME